MTHIFTKRSYMFWRKSSGVSVKYIAFVFRVKGDAQKDGNKKQATSKASLILCSLDMSSSCFHCSLPPNPKFRTDVDPSLVNNKPTNQLTNLFTIFKEPNPS
jgi:hypothetical protein